MERELWKILYRLTRESDKPWGSWKYATADVLAVYFWAVLHDRPTSWAAIPAHWPDELRPLVLPSQSTLSRRLRQPKAVELQTAVEERLQALTIVGHCLVHIFDGKALAVSGVSKDPDVGYGRGAGGHQKGYKLHAVWGAGPMPVAWGLAPMNVSEKTMARHLIPTLPGGGYLLGDSQYDANPVYDLAAQNGFQFVAKKTKDRGRGGLGHRRQSPGRLRCLELPKNGIRPGVIQLPQPDRTVLRHVGFFRRWPRPVARLGPSLRQSAQLGPSQNPRGWGSMAVSPEANSASTCIILFTPGLDKSFGTELALSILCFVHHSWPRS